MVSATRSLQLLLAYLEEAGGRMRAQGLSVHSHCGNQLVARTMTVRVQPSRGKEIEIHTSPAQTVQAFRLVSRSFARDGGVTDEVAGGVCGEGGRVQSGCEVLTDPL